MSNKFLKQIKKDFDAYDTFTQFETQRLLYSKELRRFSLEAIAYYSLKVSPLYGEKTFWPEEIPNTLRSQYKLNSIIAGASTRGGDIFAVSQNTGRLNAVEIKSRDLTAKKKNLSHGKISPKEVALNNTKIGKNDRLVITDYDDTSYLLDKDMANWASIHISEVFNEETYTHVRDYVLNDVLPEFIPYNFRTDRSDGTFHKKQLTRVFTKMMAQKKKWGQSKGLLIKPTATGKGVDPVLLVRLFFMNQWGTKKPIIITVSPSLNVLTGNVLKQMKDQSGSGIKMKSVVWASDLTPSDDPKDLALLRTQVDVAKGESNFQDLVDDASKGVWIHTTIHSYRNMEIALKAMRISRVNLKFIDEVKHTVQDWDSDFAVCVREKYVKSDHVLGLDANIVDGKEDGVEYKTSMRNKKLWREIYEEMSEEQAVKLGWKRKTKLIVAPWQDNLLPPKLYESLYENKNGLVRVKGSGVTIPFTWLASICSVIEYRIKHPDRHHTMVTTNKIEWSRKYEKAFEAILPLYLKQIKITKGNRSIINRMKKLYVKSIYNFGSSSKLIQREVDEVPNNHKDSVIIQVRLLGEGWDPKGAWLDSWSFADPTGSKIRIYQTGGRPARIGDDIFKASMFESHCVVPLILQSDLTKEIAINRAFKQLKLVAESMEVGTDTIEDSVDFLPWQNMNVAGQSTRTKGSMNKSVLVDMGIDEMQGSFKNFYKTGVRYSPWTPVADAIFEETIKLYENKIVTARLKEASTNQILKNPAYKKFFGLFAKSGRRRLPGDIRVGKCWMLSEDKKIEGKTLWRDYKNRYPNELKAEFDYIIGRLKATLKDIHPPHLHDRYIRYWSFIKDEAGNSFPHKRVGVMTSLMKGRHALYKHDKEYAMALVKQTNDIIRDYEDRLAETKTAVEDEYILQCSGHRNPTDPTSMGKVNVAVAEKFKIPYKAGEYGVVTVLAKRSKRVQQAKKKYAQKNLALLKTIMKGLFPVYIKKGKGLVELDLEVIKTGRIKHGVDFGNAGTVAEIRKKMPEFKKHQKAFATITANTVVKVREKNGWKTTKGYKLGPRKIKNKNGRYVLAKGKSIDMFPGLVVGRDKRKKTMAKKFADGHKPWNFGLKIAKSSTKKKKRA